MKQPNASIAIQILPTADGDDKVIHVVDQVIAYIKSTGLNYVVGPFETTIEGDFEQLWDIAKECQLLAIREGASNIAAYVKMFYNPAEGVWSIEKKVAKHSQ